MSLAAKRKRPPSRQRDCGDFVRFGYSDGTHSCGLRPLGALPDLEFNPLVFLERAEPAALNLRVVDKDISGAVLRCNSPALFVRSRTSAQTEAAGHPASQ